MPTETSAGTENGQVPHSLGALAARQPQAAPADEGRRRRPQWLEAFVESKLAVLGAAIFALIVLGCAIGPFFTPYGIHYQDYNAVSQAPSWSHLFGTTDKGWDLFSNVLYGGRYSLMIGITCGILTAALSMLVGMTGGYVGGYLDEVLGVITNVFLVVPQLPLLIVLVAYFQTSDQALETLLLIGVIAGTSWPWGARTLRSQVLTLKDRDFVLAARVSGEPTWRIVFREILPNMISLIAVQLMLGFTSAILTESGLEFLGIGDVSIKSWGVTLYWAQTGAALLTGEWWYFMFPGMAIALAATACTFMNYGVDAIGNPRLRKVKVVKPPSVKTTGEGRAGTRQQEAV